MYPSLQFRRNLAIALTVLPGLLFAGTPRTLQAQAPQPATVASSAETFGTVFTYQGRLTDNGSPANGQYDLSFALYDAESGGAQIGGTVVKEDVVVKDGYFMTQLDFGNAFDGNGRFLD